MKNNISFNLIIKKFRLLKELLYKEQRKEELWSDLQRRFPNIHFYKDAFADDKCKFNGPAVLGHGVSLFNCNIGSCTYFANYSRLFNCIIGNYCSIGPEVLAGLGKHPSKVFVSTHPAFYAPKNSSKISYVNKVKFNEFEKIEIGNDVWIGARATIVDGVKIGDGAIIAAGAIVTRNVEPYSIVGGSPAKAIRKRFTDSQIESLNKIKWWNRDDDWIKENAYLFDNIDAFLEKENV